MSVAKIVEIVSCSEKSFDDAIKTGISTASKTVRGITGARIIDKNVKVRDNKIVQYRVVMKLAFGIEKKE